MDLSNFWNFNPSLPVYNLPPNQYEQRGKYKRSTNNSHKKFISVARKLLFKICSEKERSCFEKQFQTYKNSRTFYFIILAHVKLRMNKDESRRFTTAFVSALNLKIQNYNNQIRNTTNSNFIHFRFQEISDIEYAIKAMELYFDEKIEEAIETVYRKDRLTLFKRQQYDAAVKTILELQKRLKVYQPGPLFPYVQQQEGYQYVSRRLPIDIIPQLLQPEINDNYQQKPRKESDQEWQAQEESACPKRRAKYPRKRAEQKFYKKQNEIQKRIMNQPLLLLETSLPFFPDFYKILFNYQITPNFPNIPAGSELLQKPQISLIKEPEVNKEVFLPFNNPNTFNNAYLNNNFAIPFMNHTEFVKQEPKINETERQKSGYISYQNFLSKDKLGNQDYLSQKLAKIEQKLT